MFRILWKAIIRQFKSAQIRTVVGASFWWVLFKKVLFVYFFWRWLSRKPKHFARI